MTVRSGSGLEEGTADNQPPPHASAMVRGFDTREQPITHEVAIAYGGGAVPRKWIGSNAAPRW